MQSVESHLRNSKNADSVEKQIEELRKAVEVLVEVVKKLERQQ